MHISPLVKKLDNRFYFYTTVLAFLLLPVLFVGNTNELFEFPKMYFVYLFALFISAKYISDLIRKRVIPKTWIPLPILFYIFSFLLSTIASSHLYTSVWGYYSRFADSLSALLAFVAIYLTLKGTLSKEDIAQIKGVSLFPIIPVSIFGISQHFGTLGNVFWFGESVDRVFSTFGQPNWLAQYLVMMLPFVLFAYIYSEKVANLWYVTFVLAYACLWFTFSISGFFAFFVTFLTSLIIFIKSIGWRKTILKSAILAVPLVLIPVLYPGIFAGRLSDLKQDILGSIQVKAFAQEVAIPDPSKYSVSDPGFIRKNLWRGTVSLIASSPKIMLIGSGPETFPYEFQPYRPRELNYSSEWNFVFNKPHNYYLEVVSETGLLGLISFAGLMIYVILRSPIVTRVSILGLLITCIFGWPVVMSWFLFWFYAVSIELREDA